MKSRAIVNLKAPPSAATGITNHLTNGACIEVARHIAGRSNAKLPEVYDRRNNICVGEAKGAGT
jgi:hypothetical protein